jgi:glyoxylase-like metal-dependent hydrolase (beta-lactamase superfamily II)
VPAPVIDFYRAAGFDAAALEALRQRGYGNFRKIVGEVPRSFNRIGDGDNLKIGGRRWSVRVGRGHSPEHACLYCPELGVLISGDQILPKISPHIGVYPSEPEANPLRQYLTSLDRFRDLPADTLVLPSHKDPFVNAGPRLDALAVHHRDRLDRLAGALTEPRTAAETMPVLFRRVITADSIFLAIAEALAHLNHLIAEGRAVRERGADGVDRYRLAA